MTMTAMAPIRAVAKNMANHSGQLGNHKATLSPKQIPREVNALAISVARSARLATGTDDPRKNIRLLDRAQNAGMEGPGAAMTPPQR
ncbi:MAG: hypothetical protein OXD42_02025 [Rhodospirillaceae bacterium]|nr:hypothetical protein [Rhodospirillaceae bacterium]